MISIGFAPQRGLIWTLIRRQGDRRRFAAQSTLRDVYKYAQSHGSVTYPVPNAMIVGMGGASAEIGLSQLEKRGYVQQQGETWILTNRGVEVASQDAYNQRLWDVYREYSDELDLPLIAEDRQKDIHEVLPEPAIEKLEQKLELEGALA